MEYNIPHLLNSTNKTSAELAAELGITYPELRDLSEMTDTELVTRDTKITIYDIVGHDGSRPEDLCARCGIILLYPDSGMPGNWTPYQSAVGNVCLSCMFFLWDKYKNQIISMIKGGCYYCGERKVKIYFYRGGPAGTREVYPYRAVPYCSEHKENLNEKNIYKTIRDYHASLGDRLPSLFPELGIKTQD